MKKTYFAVAVGLIVSQLFFSVASAAALQSFKMTLADSRAATASVETATLQLSAANTFATGETILFTWPGSFVFPADGTWTTGDFSFNDGTGRTVIAVGASPTCTAGSNNVDVVTNQASRTLTVTACPSYTASSVGATITFGIGNTNKITNPTVASYTVTVKETTDDQKDTVVVITNGVSISVTVMEALNFTVAGDTTISCPTTGGTKIDTSGDPTTIPFGAVTTGAFYDACQQLTINSNAIGGYTATVQTTQLLTSGGNTVAKGSCDGSCTDSTANTWATNTNYGYGYCLKDATGTSAATADANWGTHYCGAGSQYFKTIANAGSSQAAQSISHTTAPDTTNNVLHIGYRLNVGTTQATGAYTTTIVYVATPTY
ncbi:MAG TPA: hypothetical protein VMQ44_00540 [Candidatus Saccharimonadales bacterium]|nr:hypothetical protein [Candidatus Saccharimonadales bacterium]